MAFENGAIFPVMFSSLCLSMISAFIASENRFPLFRIML